MATDVSLIRVAFGAALFVAALGTAAQQPKAPRPMTMEEKACRIWKTKHGNVHGPTLRAIGHVTAQQTTSAGVDAAQKSASRAGTAETCVASYLETGTTDTGCLTSCVVMGVESELVGEPIRQYLEANMQIAMELKLRKAMDGFLVDLKNADEQRRVVLINGLRTELAGNPDFIQAMKNALKEPPAK
jgi:hypothetical protein